MADMHANISGQQVEREVLIITQYVVTAACMETFFSRFIVKFTSQMH